MTEAKRQLLTIGAFLVSVVVGLVLVPIIGWGFVVPVILILFGLWTLALAVMRGANPQKYERSSFSTLSLGMLLIVVGGAWSLLALGFTWVYSLALILLILAALAIAVALKRK
jgi:hypothetical protein